MAGCETGGGTFRDPEETVFNIPVPVLDEIGLELPLGGVIVPEFD